MSNTENPRDVQFKGFAKLLFEELPEPPTDDSVLGIAHAEWKEQVQQIIARRAYSLMKHAFYELDIWRNGSLDNAVQCIPDLTAWPDESEYPEASP